MVLFRYSAIDPGGKLATGEIDAESAADVVALLRRQGNIPMGAEPASSAGRFSALLHLEFGRAVLRRQEVANLTAELAVMLGAGQDLDHALRFLVETATNKRLRGVLEQIRAKVRDGGSLASAMAAHPGSFSKLYLGLVRAGEAGGTLAPTLSHLAELLDRERALSATIVSALIYPSLLMIAAIGSIVLLLTEVLPQFVPMFEQNGAKLPTPTRLLIAAGDAVSAYGLYGLLAVFLALVLARQALKRPGPRLALDKLLLRLPLTGGLTREVLAARFSRTLGTLLLNGVSLIAALGIVRDALGNQAAVLAVEQATASAKDGAGLSQPLARSAIFPARMIHLLRLGEETAQLGAMSLRAAEVHEAKARQGMQRLVSLLVPAITILMGAAIAGVVSSLLLAILALNDLAT
jgi:general secretion pathway protein F